MAVWAIRGATTVEQNSVNEIIEETKALLLAIVEKNEISQNDVISIIFTVTHDIDAAFPAVAARQIGWTDIALLCMNEIDVQGSLEKCIRILLHVNTSKNKDEIKHVYLKGAKVLRPDLAE